MGVVSLPHSGRVLSRTGGVALWGGRGSSAPFWACPLCVWGGGCGGRGQLSRVGVASPPPSWHSLNHSVGVASWCGRGFREQPGSVLCWMGAWFCRVGVAPAQLLGLSSADRGRGFSEWAWHPPLPFGGVALPGGRGLLPHFGHPPPHLSRRGFASGAWLNYPPWACPPRIGGVALPGGRGPTPPFGACLLPRGRGFTRWACPLTTAGRGFA